MLKKIRTELERTPGNGRGGLGRIRTDFVEFLKKGQEPIRTKFHFFLKQPLSGRKSNFQDKCDDFISDRATVILEKNVTKNRPDMEVWTINSGKSRGGQVQSGQISGGPLSRPKVLFQDQASPTITRGPNLNCHNYITLTMVMHNPCMCDECVTHCDTTKNLRHANSDSQH